MIALVKVTHRLGLARGKIWVSCWLFAPVNTGIWEYMSKKEI